MTKNPDPFLPYGRQSVDEDDVAAVTEVLKSGWLTQGPKVKEFEEALAQKAGARFAVACSSGTAALHLASLALELGPGDAAVVPAQTFLATANAPLYTGADVVLADVDPETALLTPETFEAALDKGGCAVKMVSPVHMCGQMADMEAIYEIAKAKGVSIVEDACHALGASYKTSDGAQALAGSCAHSDMTVFSFHPVKTAAMGEGGAVTTNDEELYKRLLTLRNHGMTREADDFTNAGMAFDKQGAPNPWYYEMHDLGFNFRASDIHCALGASQLAKLDGFVSKRRSLAGIYDEALKPLAPAVTPIGRAEKCGPAWHLYAVLIDFDSIGIERAALMNKLRELGIGTQVHYIPLHMQPYYKNRYGALSLPGAEEYYRRTLSLPLYPAMERDDVARVAKAVTEIINNV